MRIPHFAALASLVVIASTSSSCFGCLDLLPPPDGTGGGGGTSTGDFRISGQLLNGLNPGPDAAVEVRKSGTVIGATRATSGFFSLSVDPGGPTTLLITIKAEGIAPIARTLRADRVGEIELKEQVVALGALACTGTSCSTGSGLRIDGLPAGTNGFGRAFNPVTETSAFPGGFDDSDGNLLLSGAFATVELKDSSGRALTQMAAPVTLRMPFPKETWPLLVDLAAGDGKVTVPLYYFDEGLATWKREGQGDLVADDGTLIAESESATIRAGTRTAPLFVSGQVQHFSTWNVDWPISSHGCITGRILAADRTPRKAATVDVEGLTYTGHSPAIVTGDDGRFCTDVLRSETTGEDVDKNGITGQTSRVAVYVTSNSDIFDGREHTMPTMPGTCGNTCLDVGDIVLDDSSKFVTALCNVNGTLVDGNGAPIAGLQVTGYSTASSDEITALCPDYSCGSLSKTTGVDGSFSGTVAVREKLSLLAQRTDMPAANTTRTELAYLDTRGCPRGPVRLQMSPPRLVTELSVSISGQQISWSPPVTIQTLVVSSVLGDAKWGAISSPPSLVPPITFGVVPQGGFTLPGVVGGGGGALTSGDHVSVSGTVQENGNQHIYTGTAVVP